MSSRDPYRVPPDRRPTPTRVVVGSSTIREDEATLMQCPCCAGSGMVAPEVAVVVEGLMAEIGERR